MRRWFNRLWLRCNREAAPNEAEQDICEIPPRVKGALWIILYHGYHIRSVDESTRSFKFFLRPEWLRKPVGDNNKPKDLVELLDWALEHSALPYREILPDLPLSGEDCLKLIKIFRDHIHAMDLATLES